MGLAAGQVGYSWVSLQTPVAIGTVHEADGVAIRNGFLELDVTVRRERFCNVNIYRWMTQNTGEIDADGNPVVLYAPLAPAPAPTTPLGVTVRYILRVPLPPTVTVGGREYQSQAEDGCSLLPFMDRAPRGATGHVTITPDDLPR